MSSTFSKSLRSIVAVNGFGRRPIARAQEKLRRAVCESLEQRVFLSTTTLTNGTGDHALTVTVDAYGSYGSATTADDAYFDPAGPAIGSSGTTFESGLYFEPLRNFLTESAFGANLNPISFTSTSPTQAVSQFTVAGFAVTLTQTVSAITPAGSVLTQTYAFTNNNASTQNFKVARHVDGDLGFVAGLDDFAGVTGDGRFVFEFDTGNLPTTTATTPYIGISSSGGTPVGYTVQPYRYTTSIIQGNGIPAADLNVVSGDADLNRITDTGYDVTITLEDALSIAPGQTASYSTITTFSEGNPVEVTAPGQLRLDSSSYNVPESAGVAQVTVQRVNGSAGSVGVNFSTSPGTATAGADYTPVSGTLLFADGETSKVIDIPIINDSLSEGNEFFNVNLTSPSGGAAIAFPATSAVNIIDDDLPGQFQFSSINYSRIETGGVAAINVERVGGIIGTVTVDYTTGDGTATAGADYTATSGTLTFAPGELVKTINVPITDDQIVEGDETVNLALSNPTNGSSLVQGRDQSILTIVDDDSTFQFDAASYNVDENAGTAVISVTRAGSTATGASVGYLTSDGTAVDGEDYNAVAGTLSFAPGDTSKQIVIPIIDTLGFEPTENVNVSLVNAAGDGARLGAQASATLNILNVDREGPQVLDVDLVTPGPRIDGVRVTFSEPVTTGAPENFPTTFNLFAKTKGGLYKLVQVQSLQYNDDNTQATLILAKPLPLNQSVQVTVNPIGGLTDIAGNALNATGSAPASRFDAFLTRGTRITYFDSNGDKVKLGVRGGGFLELTQGADGEATSLRVVNGRPGITTLFGTVTKERDGDGITTIDDLIGIAGLNNTLSNPPFSVTRIE
jgi:hypothetical protein